LEDLKEKSCLLEYLCKQKSTEDLCKWMSRLLGELCKQKSRPLEDLCKEEELSFGGPVRMEEPSFGGPGLTEDLLEKWQADICCPLANNYLFDKRRILRVYAETCAKCFKPA
jgi:hypothetical protein